MTAVTEPKPSPAPWPDYSTPQGQPPEVHDYPHSIHALGDGSGGGIFAWTIHDESSSDDERVLAQGIAADGGEPTPRLSLMMPDAAQSGDTGSYVIFGDYLDLTLGYELVREGGSTIFVLVPDQMHSYQLVEGLTTLSGLQNGPYHLVVKQDGVIADTLEFAAGIGPLPDCGLEETVVESDLDVDLQGSKRQSAIDADGRTHLAWVEYEPASGDYALLYARREPEAWGPRFPLLVHRDPLRHVTVAADATGRAHVAVIREVAAADDRLEYFPIEPGWRDRVHVG